MAEFEGCQECEFFEKESNEHPCSECIRIAIDKYKRRKHEETK